MLVADADREEAIEKEESCGHDLAAALRQRVAARQRNADECPRGREQCADVNGLAARPAWGGRRPRCFRPWLHAADDITRPQPIASASRPTESAYRKAGL